MEVLAREPEAKPPTLKYGTRETRPIKGRECGDCNYCCKVVAVNLPVLTDLIQIQKPAGRWCDYNRDPSTAKFTKGCRIYELRPQVCRDFECLWLQSEMVEQLRPDRVKAVFGGNEDGSIVQVWIDPATPDHWRKNRILFRTIEHMRQKFTVVILWGGQRTLLSMYPSEGGGIRVNHD